MGRNEYNPLTISTDRDEEPRIPRPMHQAAVKQLVGAMAPGEVLCTKVKPGRDFCPFLAVIRGGNPLNRVFHPDKLAPDVGISMRMYHPKYSNPILAVGIEDPVDFLELIRKSGPGAGGGEPKKNVGPTRGYAAIERVFEELGISSSETNSWSFLSPDKIRKAFEAIPKQVGKVECAANSAARALILAGGGNDDYRRFNSNCPQDVKTIAYTTGFSLSIAGMTAGILLAPFTMGGSLLAVGAGAASMITGGAIAESFETGPSPVELAKYITKHIPASSPYKKAVAQCYPDFNDCAKSIASDVRSSDPVIVFIFWEPTVWHYTNVVAVKGDLEGFMILDTDCTFEYRSYDNLKHVMYNAYKFNSSFCIGGVDNYNLIRFIRK